jgi:hypothetical protein
MIRALSAILLGIAIGAGLAVATAPAEKIVPMPSPSETHDPDPVINLSGKATHYDATRSGQSTWYTRAGYSFYGAAGPRLRALVPHHWRQEYEVIVTSKRTGRAVIVHVADYCECLGGDTNPANDRLIDLAPAVWDALGVPLYLGITPVTLQVLNTP